MNLLLWLNTNIYENRTKLIQITIADTFQVGTRTIFRLYHMLYSIQFDPVCSDNLTITVRPETDGQYFFIKRKNMAQL